MSTRPRPLSPFLHYRWQYANTLSILHRLSGIALTMGFGLLVAGLVAIATGASGYARVVRLSASAPGKLLLFFILAAFGAGRGPDRARRLRPLGMGSSSS